MNPAAWAVRWSPKAAKRVEQLPRNIARRILERFDALAEEPFRYLEHITGPGYKFRIGEYRALIDLDFARRILFVRVFDKRERVYGR